LNTCTGEIQAQTVSYLLGKEACNIVEFHPRKTEIKHIPHASLVSSLHAHVGHIQTENEVTGVFLQAKSKMVGLVH